jgi:aminopeptidase 2
VTEEEGGLRIRQDRYLGQEKNASSSPMLIYYRTGTGDPTPEENQTIWQIPLFLKTSLSPSIDETLIMKDKELFLPIKDVKQQFYKLNDNISGVCESFSYT